MRLGDRVSFLVSLVNCLALLPSASVSQMSSPPRTYLMLTILPSGRHVGQTVMPPCDRLSAVRFCKGCDPNVIVLLQLHCCHNPGIRSYAEPEVGVQIISDFSEFAARIRDITELASAANLFLRVDDQSSPVGDPCEAIQRNPPLLAEGTFRPTFDVCDFRLLEQHLLRNKPAIETPRDSD